MQAATSPRYRFDPTIGQLYFGRPDDETILGDIDLMVAWSNDPECPCLHKHGRPDGVGTFLAKARLLDPDMTAVTIPWEVIRHPEAGPQVLAEVNACIACSGRVGGILERLALITADLGITIYPRG